MVQVIGVIGRHGIRVENEAGGRFVLASAARMPRAAVQRASADAKRADGGIEGKDQNDPSDLTDFTWPGTGPAKLGTAPT